MEFSSDETERKGSFVPRPRIDGTAESVASTLGSWPGVQARTHWQLGDETIVDGADFYVGEKELGHIHLYAEAHIAVPKSLRDALLEAGLAERFQWSPAFVVKKIRDAKAAREAEWLFALAYDRLKGTALDELLDRVRARRAA